jgi:hypothetical protein
MFRLVDSPRIYPYLSVTGLSVGPMVDTEVVMQKGGRVYLTEVEAREVIRHFPKQIVLRAREMGWAAPDDVAEYESVIAGLRRDLEEAQTGQPRVVAFEDVRELLHRDELAAA